MPVRSVEDEPDILLESWGIYASPWDTLHVVGSPCGTTRARRSSPVESFDVNTMTAVTESGRTYRLVGEQDHVAARLIAVTMFGAVAYLGKWISAEELALAVARPDMGGWH
jgi:hypothetical protein